MDLYIYYRVASDNAGLLQEKVTRMQAALAQRYGVAAALKRRPGQQSGQHTWMEVYLAVPDGFEQALEQAVNETGLPAIIDGARHIEHFLDTTSCA